MPLCPGRGRCSWCNRSKGGQRHLPPAPPQASPVCHPPGCKDTASTGDSHGETGRDLDACGHAGVLSPEALPPPPPKIETLTSLPLHDCPCMIPPGHLPPSQLAGLPTPDPHPPIPPAFPRSMLMGKAFFTPACPGCIRKSLFLFQTLILKHGHLYRLGNCHSLSSKDSSNRVLPHPFLSLAL